MKNNDKALFWMILFLTLACLAFGYAAWIKWGMPAPAANWAPTATYGAELFYRQLTAIAK